MLLSRSLNLSDFFGSNFRTSSPPSVCRSRPSPQTQKLLKKFAAKADWSLPGNPADMEKFWDFVISAYQKGEHDITLNEFLRVINDENKNGTDALEINPARKKRELAAKMFMFSKYEDGIRLLKKFASSGNS